MHQAKRGAGASLHMGTTSLHMVTASLHMVTTSLNMCTAQAPAVFEEPLVVNQLRYLGVMETVRPRHLEYVGAAPRIRSHPFPSVHTRLHRLASSRIVSPITRPHALSHTLSHPHPSHLSLTLAHLAHPHPVLLTYPAGAHPPRGIPGQVRLRPNRDGLPRAAHTRHVCVSMYRPSAYARPRLCTYQARMCTAAHRPSCAARVPPCVALACLALPHQAG